jgi:RHS repeat-associated protein
MAKETVTQSSRFYCVSTTPDFCKTPVGSATPPLPYTIKGEFKEAKSASPNVKSHSEPVILHNKSYIPSVTGDEPGTAKGIKSGTVGKRVETLKFSSSYGANGTQLVREGDMVWMNDRNTVGQIYERGAQGAKPTHQDYTDKFRQTFDQTGQQVKAELDSLSSQINQKTKDVGHALTDAGHGILTKIQSGIDQTRNALKPLAQDYKNNISASMHQFGQDAMATGGKVAAASGVVGLAGVGVAATGVGAPVAVVMEAGAAAGGTVGGVVTGVGAAADSGATLMDKAADWVIDGKSPNLLKAAEEIGTNLAQNVILAKLTGLAGKLIPKKWLQKPGTKPEPAPHAQPHAPQAQPPAPPPNRKGSDGGKEKPGKPAPSDRPKDECPKNCALPGIPLSENKRAHFATGEEILYQHDFTLQGALPLSLVRCYRSGSETEDWGVFGARWACEFTESLSVSKRGIVFHDATGRTVRLPLLPIGEQFDSASEGFILQRDSDEQFTLTWRDGEQHIHRRGPNGWLPHGYNGVNQMLKAQAPLAVRRYHLIRKQVRDGRGYSVEHYPNAEPGQVMLRIRNDDGRILDAIRAVDSIEGQRPVIGQIEQLHPDGTRTCHARYHYASEPGAGVAPGTTGMPGAPDSQFVSQFAPPDHFQAAHPAFVALPPRVNLIEQANILGHTCHYQYRQHLLTEYRTAGGTAYQIDWVSLSALRERWQGSPLGQDELAQHFPIFINTSYQARVCATRCADGTWPHQMEYLSDDCTRVIEPDNSIWEYHYNHQWLATRVLQYLPGQTYPVTLGKRRWSKAGYLLEDINAEHQRTSYEYDANGNPISEIDANGHITRTEYNAANLPVTIIDAMGRTTRIAYDAQGRVTRHTDPLNRSTGYEYNAQGQLIRITDAKGGISHLAYDASGNLTNHTDCSGFSTNYQYDQNANLIAQTNALGLTTTWQYDQLNRLAAVRHPDGTREVFVYDAEDNLLTHLDPQNQRTAYRYNGQNQPIQRTDANGQTLHYQYDAALRLKQIINHNDEAYQFTYHPQGWLASETGFDGKTTNYAYDAAGRLKSSDSAGQKTEFLRDATGQLLAKLTPDAQVRYAYDPVGRLIAVQSKHAENHFRFDAAGQLIEERSQIRIAKQSTSPSPRPLHYEPANTERAFTLEHRYDELGNRIETILPNGRTIDTLRYGSGHWHGTLWQKNSLIDLERDALHRETRRSMGQGLSMQKNYDAQSRLAQFNFQRAGTQGTQNPGQRAQQRLYHYDTSGNLLDINDSQRGNLHYRYDPLGQLLSAVQPGMAETFAFDPAGNLLDPQAATRANQDLQNQPEPDQAARPAIAKVTHNLLKSYLNQSYQYDVQGNTVLKRPIRVPKGSGDIPQSYEYDSDNRLTKTSTTHPAKNSQGEYWYDAFNRRIAKRAVFELLDLQTGKLKQRTVETTFFVWDGDVLLQEIDGCSNAKTTTYLMEPESFVPLARIESDEMEEIYSRGTVYLPEIVEWQLPLAQWDACAHVRALADYEGERKQAWLRAQRKQEADARANSDLIHFYQVDHLGTPLELFDQHGNSVWEARYKAWGSVWRFDAEQVKQPLRFQGQYWDEESGLHYNRHRYYDPVTARFVTQDPIGLAGGSNEYRYSMNPTYWIDSLGLAPCPIKLNVVHIFHGETNRRGRPTGFHHQGSIGNNDKSIAIHSGPPNAHGVYEARVGVLNPSTGIYQTKISTMFPNSWSRARVLSEIRSAHQNAINSGTVNGNKFKGVSCSGVEIEGYLDASGNINTAFPKL